MPRIVTYNSVSLDGYFTDATGDMSWAHKRDPEWQAYVIENAKGGGQLLFGRVTYDLMASFWPTALAAQANPVVVHKMNAMPKYVFSRTLNAASWSNTKLFQSNLEENVRNIKSSHGPDITIMGSGSIVAQLSDAGLIDEYQIVVNPLVLGKGRTLFEGIQKRLSMDLIGSRTFGNGNVVLKYVPSA